MMWCQNLVSLALIATTLTGSSTANSVKEQKCDLLKTGTSGLSFSQENAPNEISAVLPLIYERVNRELEGVVNVDIKFTGGINYRRVGEHTVQCSVTRLLSSAILGSTSDDYTKWTDEFGREVVTQCFLIPVTILDVDECSLPIGEPMRHQCHGSSICVNTLGSYECLCPLDGRKIAIPDGAASKSFWENIRAQPRSPWELSFGSSSVSSCPALATTFECCDGDAHDSKEGIECRASFKCPIDPCSDKDDNDCVSSSKCLRASAPLNDPSYTCECKEGLMGNGHTCRKGIDLEPKPMVRFDGVTPTEETVKNGLYCGCTRPVIDPCAGFPKCEGKNEMCVSHKGQPKCDCKPGYVNVEGFGCVDEEPPVLKLRHDDDMDGITRFKQGDTYKEYAVDVIDDNAEDYFRSLKINYSKPPPKCFTHIGSFQVNYTVATPWTIPPYVGVTRNVIIDDIDECRIDIEKYEVQCPEIIPHCDTNAGAVCQNTIGSYTCKCPRYTSGDGFLFIDRIIRDDKGKFIDAPSGYNGGTGCRDTSAPVIEVLGPNPKIFRTCKCGGLGGTMQETTLKNSKKNEKLGSSQRATYEEDIQKMIENTAGAELCATHTNKNPDSSDCIRSTDHTYLGAVDLSSKVTVGTPVQISQLHWKVPYNVKDKAGNAAETVWREIIVEEVDIDELESKIRDGVLADKDIEIKKAVHEALENERKLSLTQNKKNSSSSCPSCPSCEKGSGISMIECQTICDERRTCPGAPRELYTAGYNYFTSFPEEIHVTNLLYAVVGFVLFLGLMVFIQRVQVELNLNKGQMYYHSPEDEQREQEMLNSVTYFRSPEHNVRNTSQPGISGNDHHLSTSPVPGSGRSGRTPPRVSLSVGSVNGYGGDNERDGGSVFSTSQQVRNEEHRAGISTQNNGEESIYQNMSPIPATRSDISQQYSARENPTPYNLRRRY